LPKENPFEVCRNLGIEEFRLHQTEDFSKFSVNSVVNYFKLNEKRRQEE